MNDHPLIRNALRKEFGKVGFTLMLHYAIMNLGILLVLVGFWIVVYLAIHTGPGATVQQLQQINVLIEENLPWGYTLGVLICSVLLVWKHPRLCFRTMWKTRKPMSWGRFFLILPIFISGQALFQLLTPLLEWLFGWMGLSLSETIASATGSSDSLSMFLYICLLAPIWEEILFRGYVLRTLEPFGKKFAIVASAFLFGV